MNVQDKLKTDRLSLENLEIKDHKFIFELLNTEGWLKFIGDRNVHSDTDAIAYIERIMGNPNLNYWVVKLKNNQTALGIITFIQRDYLEHPDIGFAFLPQYSGKGYAFEATIAVLKSIFQTENLSHILATTIPKNVNSIKLLEKLGLRFEREIETGGLKLSIYGALVGEIAVKCSLSEKRF